MAQTFKTYVSDGTQTIYTFEFDYIQKGFIKVSVDGVDTPFTLTGPYQVTLDTAPPAGIVLIIRRETPTDSLVTFVDGSVLVAKDLNLSALQATHIAAEALDKASGSLLIDDAGNYTAGFRKVSNLGDPTEPRDAVTKEWAETAQTAQLQQAVAARVASETARDVSVTKRDEAVTAASDAQAASTDAAASKVAAKASEVEAKAQADLAFASQGQTATALGQAEAARDGAALHEVNAAQEAQNAAASAAAAATFSPTNYVSKHGDTLDGSGTLVIPNSTHALVAGQGNLGLSFFAHATNGYAGFIPRNVGDDGWEWSRKLSYYQSEKQWYLGYNVEGKQLLTKEENNALYTSRPAVMLSCDGTGVVQAGYGASVTSGGVGVYTITFDTPMPSTNYHVSATTYVPTASGDARSHVLTRALTTTGFTLNTIDLHGTGVSWPFSVKVEEIK